MGDMETRVTRGGCSQDQFFNPILTMGYQVAAILVLSHAFQLCIKFIPGPIAQILVSMSSIYLINKLTSLCKHFIFSF